MTMNKNDSPWGDNKTAAIKLLEKIESSSLFSGKDKVKAKKLKKKIKNRKRG